MLLAAHCHCMTYAPRGHVQLPKLQKAGARFARDLIYYQPTAGRPELRAALAAKEEMKAGAGKIIGALQRLGNETIKVGGGAITTADTSKIQHYDTANRCPAFLWSSGWH